MHHSKHTYFCHLNCRSRNNTSTIPTNW